MQLQAEGDREILWQVEGTPAVLGWHHAATGSCMYLGHLGDIKKGTGGTELGFWIGHVAGNVSGKVAGIRLGLKARSTGKNPQEVFLVLPLSKAKVQVRDSHTAGSSLPGDNVACSVNPVCFSLSLATAPYAMMPVPRRQPQKPLADSPGQLVQLLQSLTAVNHVDVYVAERADAHGVMHPIAEALRIDNSLEDVALDLGKPDSFGSTRAINCWQLYPVAADECVFNTHDPQQPCVNRDPPAYNECVAPATTAGDAEARYGHQHLLSPSPPKDQQPWSSPPDEQITWHIPPTPNKRKASGSPPRRREAPSKARLDELNETATQPASTAEVLKWAGRVGAAALHQPRSTSTSTSTSAAADGSDSDLRHYQSVETFHRPDVRAPSTAMPLTSIWRTELTETNAIFFDMVVVLQRALQSETRAHETYLSGFLHLGLTARCAVYEIGPQCSRPCTPAQEQAYDAFVKARDRLAARVIADAGKRAPRNAWDTEPFPSAPDKQVEYVRCWVNEHLQVNADMDLFHELADFGRAAERLKDGEGLQDGEERHSASTASDRALNEFEFARAACLAAAFYRMGGHLLMKGKRERSPSLGLPVAATR